MLTKEEVISLCLKEYNRCWVSKLVIEYYYSSRFYESDIPMFEKLMEVATQRLAKIYKKRLMENYLC